MSDHHNKRTKGEGNGGKGEHTVRAVRGGGVREGHRPGISHGETIKKGWRKKEAIRGFGDMELLECQPNT